MTSRDHSEVLVCVCNLLTGAARENYRVGLPCSGRWREALNTDSAFYGGADWGNLGGVDAEPVGWHEQPCSAELVLGATVLYVPE